MRSRTVIVAGAGVGGLTAALALAGKGFRAAVLGPAGRPGGLGARPQDYALHAKGVTVQIRTAQGADDEHGIALIGADGLWSMLRPRLGDERPARFVHRTAWRAMLPAKPLVPEFREPVVSLWLGPDAHLVPYPVRARDA